MWASSSTTRSLPSLLMRQRKRNAKLGATASHVFRDNRAGMRLHDLVTDRKAEAGARFATRGPHGGAAEILEQPLGLALGDARALVAHRDRTLVPVRLRAHGDRRPGRRELERVAEEIVQHLADLRLVERKTLGQHA